MCPEALTRERQARTISWCRGSVVRTKSSLVRFSPAANTFQLCAISSHKPGLFTLSRGHLLDFLPVFVEAGEKEHFLAQTPPRAGDHVGGDFFIGMAEVRLAVQRSRSRS